MKKYFTSFTLLFIFSSFLQEKSTFDINQQLIDEKVVFVFAGDIMGHSPQYKAAYNVINNQFNYNPCFEFVKPYIQEADYAFANLEVPLAGKPYSGYPAFSSPDELLDATKNAGFDIILTANNHVADRGKQGLERTINVIRKNNLDYAGSYLSKAQRDSIYPLILNHAGFRIAVLNCTYGTNMNPVHNPNIVNMLDSAEILADINKAKGLKADFIIATMHWGIEYELHSNKYQEDFAHFLASNDVDLIIGSHPHVVQNADFIEVNGKNVPVVYSLGNFISNQRKIHTNGGILAKI
jgi:poly-gamma-glutamate synthesis protein (capsule biosynthesis protein)